MISNVAFIVMVIVMPLKNILACMPTPVIDDILIPITTTPPAPCSKCQTPIKVVEDRCQQLTITPCDENNRIIYNCGFFCGISTQNEPTDAFINRLSSLAEVTCDPSGNYYIGTPTDQIKAIRCA